MRELGMKPESSTRRKVRYLLGPTVFLCFVTENNSKTVWRFITQAKG